jgi:hypothetical protein
VANSLVTSRHRWIVTEPFTRPPTATKCSD